MTTVLSLITLFAICQDVKTSDGVVVGDREYIIASYAARYNPTTMKGKVEIDPYDFYACFCDNVIPHIHSRDLIPSMKSGNIQSLLLNETYSRYLSICFDRHLKLDEDFRTSDLEYSEETLKVMKKACLNELRSNPEIKGNLTELMMIDLCDCMTERVSERDIKMSELQKFDNTDTEAYNEIGMACLDEITSKYNQPSSIEKPKIVGSPTKITIPLIYISGEGYKVKIQFGSIKRYFLIDTGASDLVITEELASELMSEGVISEYDYLSKEDRILADGSIITVKRVRIKELAIGAYKVQNIEASIVENGSPLCGMELLNTFSNWELIPSSKELRLYK
ncbi:MAG: clan AA aspartic protease (TIGR02281 family) [Marinoscillum sp.]|jgi:clan AA aspartic protease (TIGR02281 family)